MAYDIRVDPKQMVLVTLDGTAGATQELAAVSCRLVPVGEAGERRIAAEIVMDPGMASPSAAYFCPTNRLQRLLVPPNRVRGVRPYAA
jgi:hypothetical protein